MIRVAEHVLLIADSSKINRSSFTRLGTLDGIHSFITDDGIRDEDARAFESRGIKMIIAN
jgi:DeoR/GlpR family transcriptional regulator of sugar metabolism